MNRFWNCACVLLPVAGAAGCGAGPLTPVMFALANIQMEADCSEQEATATVPEAVPPELVVALDDPSSLAAEDHPLRVVSLGTVIDDISEVDGCWGRFYHEIGYDPFGLFPFIEIEQTEALRFDLSQGLAYHHTYNSWTTGFGLPTTDGPAFTTSVYEVTIVDENMLSFTFVSGEGGAVEEDGSVAFDCWRSGGPFNLVDGSTLTVIMTLQGDYMNMLDLLDGLDSPPLSEQERFGSSSGEYWVRIDCPSP